MTTDRTLLELAAKAIGGKFSVERRVPWFTSDEPGIEYEWDPRNDDGDSFRLMVALRLKVEVNGSSSVVWRPQREDGDTPVPIYEYPEMDNDQFGELGYINHDKATRRAILDDDHEMGKD